MFKKTVENSDKPQVEESMFTGHYFSFVMADHQVDLGNNALVCRRFQTPVRFLISADKQIAIRFSRKRNTASASSLTRGSHLINLWRPDVCGCVCWKRSFTMFFRPNLAALKWFSIAVAFWCTRNSRIRKVLKTPFSENAMGLVRDTLHSETTRWSLVFWWSIAIIEPNLLESL